MFLSLSILRHVPVYHILTLFCSTFFLSLSLYFTFFVLSSLHFQTLPFPFIPSYLLSYTLSHLFLHIFTLTLFSLSISFSLLSFSYSLLFLPFSPVTPIFPFSLFFLIVFPQSFFQPPYLLPSRYSLFFPPLHSPAFLSL